MNKIVAIESNLEHKVSEVICVKCGYRWIATRPSKTLLKQLECPNCNEQGYTVETGEEIL